LPHWGGANSHVINCYVTGKINTGGSTSLVGGVVGYMSATTASVKHCYSLTVVESMGGSGTGGLVGAATGGTIENCYVTGKVSAVNGVGGILGVVSSGTVSIMNSAALNQAIIFANSSRPSKRILGDGGSSLSGNFAWNKMLLGLENSLLVLEEGMGANDNENGEDKSTADILKEETWKSSGFDETYWLIKNGQLPILRRFDTESQVEQIAEYAKHIFDDADVEETEIPEEQKWYFGHRHENVFYIKNAAELASLPYIVRVYDLFVDKTINLTADIDLALNLVKPELEKYTIKWGGSVDAIPYDEGGWVPINGFEGTFDGNGHVIKNLDINRPTEKFQGLFGQGWRSKIRNLGVIDANVVGGDHSGIIGGAVHNVENCFTTGSVSGYGGVGGIMGHANGTNRNSYSTANVEHRGDRTSTGFCEGFGGAVGCSDLISDFTNFYTTGTVGGQGWEASRVSGSGIIRGFLAGSTGVGFVALNQSLNGGYGRVTVPTEGVSNSYAWEYMLLDGTPITDDLRDNGTNGTDVTALDIYTGTVWDADHADYCPGGYEDCDWIIEKGKLPILRIFESRNDSEPTRGGVSVQPSAIPDYILAALPKVTGVTVSPATASVEKGETHQFTVDVDIVGVASDAVTWTVTGNISTGTTIVDGLLTVGDDESATTLTVTATSVFDNTKSGTATVTVTAPIVLSSIAVTTPPTKTVYTVGDNLNLAGLIITATYSDDNTDAVTTYTTTPANGAALNTVGTKTVSISYTEGGVTKTATFNVTVNPVPTYAFAVSAGVGGTVSGTVSDSYVEGHQVSVTATANIGYHFVDWTAGGVSMADNTANPATFDMPADEVTLTAVFAINEYTVTFVDWDNEVIEEQTGIEHGTSATAPDNDPTRDGCTFTGWDVEFDNVTEDLTVTAVYEINTYTVTFNPQGGSVNPASRPTNASGTVSLPKPTRDGYTFDGWYTKKTGGDKVTESTVFEDDTPVYAHWTVNSYKVTFSSGSNGFISATVGGKTIKTGAEVDYGESVKFTAEPNEGYKVSGWKLGSKTVSGNKTKAYTIDEITEAVTVTVSFDKTDAVLTPDRVIPNAKPDEEATVTAPVVSLTGEFTAGPNPVGRELGSVGFFRQGKRIASGELRIYDAVGNVVNKVKISDNIIGNQARRQVGIWDLTDSKGRPVSEGTYLVRGVLKTSDGKREKVSMIVGVR